MGAHGQSQQAQNTQSRRGTTLSQAELRASIIVELACKNGAAAGAILFLHRFLKSLQACRLLNHRNLPTRARVRTRTWALWRAWVRGRSPLHKRTSAGCCGLRTKTMARNSSNGRIRAEQPRGREAIDCWGAAAQCLTMRKSASAKEVEAQSGSAVRDSSIRNPLAFEKAWRAALTLSDGFAPRSQQRRASARSK